MPHILIGIMATCTTKKGWSEYSLVKGSGGSTGTTGEKLSLKVALAKHYK